MISSTRAIKILTEKDPVEQAKLIGKLSEQESKHLLGIAVKLLRGEDPSIKI